MHDIIRAQQYIETLLPATRALSKYGREARPPS